MRYMLPIGNRIIYGFDFEEERERNARGLSAQPSRMLVSVVALNFPRKANNETVASLGSVLFISNNLKIQNEGKSKDVVSVWNQLTTRSRKEAHDH